MAQCNCEARMTDVYLPRWRAVNMNWRWGSGNYLKRHWEQHKYRAHTAVVKLTDSNARVPGLTVFPVVRKAPGDTPSELMTPDGQSLQ